MSITADLKPDEIEITQQCRVRDCKVSITHAYSNHQVQIFGMPALKRQTSQIVANGHKDGSHDKAMEKYKELNNGR